jgi:hypothetical protein
MSGRTTDRRQFRFAPMLRGDEAHIDVEGLTGLLRTPRWAFSGFLFFPPRFPAISLRSEEYV